MPGNFFDPRSGTWAGRRVGRPRFTSRKAITGSGNGFQRVVGRGESKVPIGPPRREGRNEAARAQRRQSRAGSPRISAVEHVKLKRFLGGRFQFSQPSCSKTCTS